MPADILWTLGALFLAWLLTWASERRRVPARLPRPTHDPRPYLRNLR